MNVTKVLLASAALAVAATGTAKPLISVPSYKGAFVWLKAPALPESSFRSLASAKVLVLTVSFPKNVALKKDRGGNTWFTFIVADQGPDWGWHQTTGFAGLPVTNGTIKAGRYKISVPVAGIPRAILKGSKQTISIGPATSGLVKPVSFTIDSISG